MRGVTFLPGMNTHFDVSRPRSVAAVERAMLNDQRAFLVTQRELDVEEPSEKDLYTYGTVVCIKQLIKMPNKIVRVLAEGLERAKLLSLEDPELDHVAERGGLDGQQLEIGTRCLFFRKRDFAGMIVLLFLVVVARVILAGMIVPFRFVIVELGSVVARFGLAGAPLPVRAGVSATCHECCGQYADYQ